MDESNKKIEELKEAVGFDEPGEHRKKTARIIKDERQLSIRIPKKFAEVMDIDKDKDYFEFHLVPIEEGGFRLEAVLVKE